MLDRFLTDELGFLLKNNHSCRTVMRFGVVAADPVGTPPKIEVYVGGSATAFPMRYCYASPTIGDAVVVLVNDNADYVALAKIQS